MTYNASIVCLQTLAGRSHAHVGKHPFEITYPSPRPVTGSPSGRKCVSYRSIIDRLKCLAAIEDIKSLRWSAIVRQKNQGTEVKLTKATS